MARVHIDSGVGSSAKEGFVRNAILLQRPRRILTTPILEGIEKHVIHGFCQVRRS